MESLIDIILDILTFLLFGRKRKKSGPLDALNLKSQKKSSKPVSKKDVPVCAGCHMPIKFGAVYELGKTWRPECYKTRVLKIS